MEASPNFQIDWGQTPRHNSLNSGINLTICSHMTSRTDQSTTAVKSVKTAFEIVVSSFGFLRRGKPLRSASAPTVRTRSCIALGTLIIVSLASCSTPDSSPTSSEEVVPQPEPPVLFPKVSLFADRDSSYPGIDSITLTWESQNAVECTASGAWQGVRPLQGKQVVRTDSSGLYWYGMECVNSNGAKAQSTRVVQARYKRYASCEWSFIGGFWTNTGGKLSMLGEYLPQNNAFWDWETVGRTMQSCMQFELRNTYVAGEWNWKIDADTTDTKFYGYPSIHLGGAIQWSAGQTTSQKLPKKVSDISDEFAVRFDFDVEARGHALSLIDINLNETMVPDNCRQVEIMIMTYAVGPKADIIGDNRIWPVAFRSGGVDFTVPPYGRIPNNSTECAGASGAYVIPVQAHATTTVLNGTIPLKPYLDYLISKGTITRDWVVQGIFFGTEIGWGSGRVNLRRYEIIDK